MSFNIALFQWRNRLERRQLTDTTPVLLEFLSMQRRSLHHQSQRPGREGASQHRYGLDLQYSPMLPIPHVKVGWWVIVIVHRDDNAKEPADLRHPRNLAPDAIRNKVSLWRRPHDVHRSLPDRGGPRVSLKEGAAQRVALTQA
jgi:hypothetical protein